MTLKEAHELQRRELISLRAKVARLEKQATGLFPVEEKEALERHIRHLEQVNRTEHRMNNNYYLYERFNNILDKVDARDPFDESDDSDLTVLLHPGQTLDS